MQLHPPGTVAILGQDAEGLHWLTITSMEEAKEQIEDGDFTDLYDALLIVPVLAHAEFN